MKEDWRSTSLTWPTSHHIIISLALTTASWIARVPYTVRRDGFLSSVKKQYVNSKLHRRCTLRFYKPYYILCSFLSSLSVCPVFLSLLFPFFSQSHETVQHFTYARTFVAVRFIPRVRHDVPPLLVGPSSSNTTRSLRVNDTTLTDEPTSDWLAMQSITEYSDNSTRRVPPLGFPPSERSAVSVQPRPTCTLARRHSTQGRQYESPRPLPFYTTRSEMLHCLLST